MADRRFRFAVMAAWARDGAGWAAQARRVEELGYTTLLTPDTSGTAMPAASLAAAAGATTTLRVGTFVLSAATRPPNTIAWEAASMAFATGDRFELGIGAGRPGGEDDAAVFGVPYGSGAERLARVEQVLDAVANPPEGLFAGTGRPPRVLVAASRRRMLELAARRAGTVAFGVPPMTDDERLAGYVEIVRTAAGDRFDDLELCTQVHVVGDEVPEWLSRQMDVDTAAMAKSNAIAKLSGTPREMADTLTRRRDELGVSYVSVSSAFMEEFAPVVELLAGR
ncbi:LLM class flavin-dependent oxidoreductase [Actinomadura darangshiensis]|uniref:LLM class flavin-dependent oxidoreductase n=1 Tax=Actinomadura darangshiensis TaxID=705336 RepID=A0A4R4ZKI7_9ACTN|nr:LLM class flavin-dependent oxidoreductase [Actinomadura darangshiensis]TDD58314.1 LLM class flavin-dependent oxidoreductase [Actinomadura darangshiensis]